jgi:hypothetical protein
MVNGGELTPHEVVDYARDPKNPLHTSFDWDDSSAGDKYRLMQARVLLTTVKVEYMGERVDAYINATVTIGNRQIRKYFPVERAMTEDAIKREVLKNAVRELRYAQEKYKRYQELAGIIDEERLDSLSQELEE